MKEQQNKLKTNFSEINQHDTQNKTIADRGRNWHDGKSKEKGSHFFGVERGNRYVRRFKLLFQDGRVVSMPYAHLPLFEFDPVGSLFIKTSEIIVIIKGRNMSKLTDWFSEEKVLWVKESPSGIDDGDAEVFVKSIEVRENNES